MRRDWIKFSTHPQAIHWSLKNDLTPDQVALNAHKKYLFDCDQCDHEFFITPRSVNSGSWCPYCNSSRICGKEECESCFEKSLASNEKAVRCWSPLNKLLPIETTKNCNTKCWINCDKCPHTFEATPRRMTVYNNPCPYCKSTKLCDYDNCNFCYEMSFASHEKAECWSSKNKVAPRQIRKSYQGKCWFDCPDCGHSYDTQLNNVVLRNTGCRYCLQNLCDDDECEICYSRSFASHEKAKYWSSKNTTAPRMLRLGSEQKCWFDCSNCGHTFLTTPYAISLGKWCRYCCRGSSTFCEDIDCEFCFNKSFASHPKVVYWSANNDEDPRRVSMSSPKKKYEFVCKNAHSFETSTNAVSGGAWCPYCFNKTEAKFYDGMQPLYPDLTKQFKAEWCKNIQLLRFDFCIESLHILIEVDGPQHHVQISNWASPETVHKRDLYKMKCANENGYSVIRVSQPDIWKDTIDWVNLVKEAIEQIVEIGVVQNHYISSKDIYRDFPRGLEQS